MPNNNKAILAALVVLMYLAVAYSAIYLAVKYGAKLFSADSTYYGDRRAGRVRG